MERSPEEIIKETLDGHMGFQVSDAIHNTSFKKSKAPQGSLVTEHPSDKNVWNPAYKYGKRDIEKKCAEERRDAMGSFLTDCVQYRAEEVLDPEAMPIAKLVELAIKTQPKQVELKVDMNVGLMSLYDDIDAED